MSFNSQLEVFSIPKRSGIYFFYLPKFNIGYVGRSNNLRLRYHQHVLEGSHRIEIIEYVKLFDDLEYLILEFTDGYKIKDQRIIEKQWIQHFKRKGVKLLNKSDPTLEFNLEDRKAVIAYTKDTLQFVGRWDSVYEASKKVGCGQPNISRVLIGKPYKKTGQLQRSAKGLFWFYEEGFTEEKLKQHKEKYDFSIKTWKLAVAKTNEKTGKLRCKKINQYDLSGNFIKQWFSAIAVEKEGITSNNNICTCLKGKTKTAGGYIWKYAED